MVLPPLVPIFGERDKLISGQGEPGLRRVNRTFGQAHTLERSIEPLTVDDHLISVCSAEMLYGSKSPQHQRCDSRQAWRAHSQGPRKARIATYVDLRWEGGSEGPPCERIIQSC